MRGHAQIQRGPITPVSMATAAWLPCRHKNQVSLGDGSVVCVCAYLWMFVWRHHFAMAACTAHAGLDFLPWRAATEIGVVCLNAVNVKRLSTPFMVASVIWGSSSSARRKKDWKQLSDNNLRAILCHRSEVWMSSSKTLWIYSVKCVFYWIFKLTFIVPFILKESRY